MPTKTTDLAVATAPEYVALSLDTSELTESLAESLGSEGFGPNDFDTLTVPNATAAPVWNLPDSDESPKQLKGIIIFHQPVQTLWLKPLNEGNSNMPPDCVGRKDQRTGELVGSQNRQWVYENFKNSPYVQRPEGLVNEFPSPVSSMQKQLCETCPFSQWKTAQKGGGQFCTAKRDIYMLLPDRPFPVLVKVPPTSLISARKYFLSLSKSLLGPSNVETILTLQKENATPPYYKIVFTKGPQVDRENAARAKAYGA
ncbi:MAG: hypothetical protein BGO39_03100, partial [Chloroflexi bacterium 54-19]